MDISGSSIPRDERPVRPWLTPGRIALYSAVMLVIGVLLAAILLWIGFHSTDPGTFRPGSGYMVFWSASHLMLHGSPWLAYDIPAFSRELATLFPLAGRHAFLPWLYPPSYLLAVTPLALLPYAISYPVFVVLGIVLLHFTVNYFGSEFLGEVVSEPQTQMIYAGFTCLFYLAWAAAIVWRAGAGLGRESGPRLVVASA